jgi:spore coat polysaccharide biosynthesis protein SpsF (cytidylyltransferase family)
MGVYATFVTARLGSSRLPRKMLLEIGGRSVIERVVTRLRRATRPEILVVCTTAEKEDDELEATVRELGVEVYRGDRDDILMRWLGAADELDVEFFAACDGDDLLCDPGYVDRVIECHEESGADYITCVGLPFGMAPIGIDREALRRVCALKRESDTAGQGRFFADERVVSRQEVVAPSDAGHPEARLTLDYPEDVLFFEALLAELAPFDDAVSPEAVVELLRNNAELVQINAGRQAEYWQRFNELYPPVELGPR